MSLKDSISCAQDVVSAAIASGTSLSNAVNLGGLRLFGFIMPSGWTTAALTFLASFDNGSTYVTMESVYDGTEITYTVSPPGYYPLPNPQIFAAVTDMKVQSGPSSAPVNQTADRAIQLVLRSI